MARSSVTRSGGRFCAVDSDDGLVLVSGAGQALYEHFVARARAAHPQVQTGRFAADMKVQLINDGPVTVPLRIAPPGTDNARGVL